MWPVFRHRKGMNYLGLGRMVHSETRELLYSYFALYENSLGPLWVRPEAMFQETLEGGQRRFAPIATLRRVGWHENRHYLMLGFDAWGGGMDEESFRESYNKSPMFMRGQRYVLELPGGDVVATGSLLRLGEKCSGLASIATHKTHQRQGWGTLMTRCLMAMGQLERQDMGFFLFSEISPDFYQRLGFRPVPQIWQKHAPSVAMQSGSFEPSIEEYNYLNTYF